MGKQIKLNARPRSETGRNAVKRVHARGAVPAVVYGAKQAPTNLEIDRKMIETVLSRAAGEHVLVDLEIDEPGKPASRLAIIQEVQHHPVKGIILHVDFHAVSTTEELEAEVPIEAVGEPDGVKNYGGVLQQALRMLLIKCLPQNLPDLVRADISALAIGESIHVKDLKLPQGVSALNDPDLTVFIVAEPKVAEEPAAAAEATTPEVIKEKKADEPAGGEKK